MKARLRRSYRHVKKGKFLVPKKSWLKALGNTRGILREDVGSRQYGGVRGGTRLC